MDQLKGLFSVLVKAVKDLEKVIEDCNHIGLDLSVSLDPDSLRFSFELDRFGYGPEEHWSFDDLSEVLSKIDEINARLESEAFDSLSRSGLGPTYLEREGDQFSYVLYTVDQEDRDVEYCEIGYLLNSETGGSVELFGPDEDGQLALFGGEQR
jgi:hypothetical protein